MDLSPFEGFFIEAESDATMRTWIEIRSGEAGYYSSIKLRPGGRTRQFIPFVKFYAKYRGREAIPLEEIDALFITSNTSSSRTGISSGLTIKEMGFYRP